MNPQTITIKKDGNGWLSAYMPNGDLIPMQVDCIISSCPDVRGMVKVNMSAQIKIEDFEIVK